MISSPRQTQSTVMPPPKVASAQVSSHKLSPHRLMLWTCLLLACVGASWFSVQVFLEPRPARFAAPWQNAQWVQATDGNAPTAYFRYTTSLNTLPDVAVVTVAANQIFRLYVNGVFIATNPGDIVQGSGLHAYIYEVLSTLQTGPNVIAVRVINLDKQPPSLRASFGIAQGSSISYRGTGAGWQATTQSALVYPRYDVGLLTWITNTFDSSSWLPVRMVANLPASPPLTANPLLYERALATQWMSAGASHDAYFVRTIWLPVGTVGAWLRIAATGPAIVSINGKQVIAWNDEAPVPPHVANYLSDQETIVQYQKGLLVGLYDVSPYLRAGTNTVAVHVSSPGSSAAQNGLNTLSAALALDMFTSDLQNRSIWFSSGIGWQVSTQASANWEQGGIATRSWSSPISIGRSGVTRSLYVPDNPTRRNISILPLSLLAEVVLLSVGAILGLLLFISLLTLALVFTLTADRYVYPLLPALYLMGAYALLKGLRTLWSLVSAPLASQQEGLANALYSNIVSSSPMRLMMIFTASLVCASVLILPMLPISNYNLFVSRQAGFLYHRHYPDYDAVGQYMHDHWRKGDIVISVSPAISILYYVGHVNYFFSIDRALYLFEWDGRIVDTPTGSIPLLSQSDFQAVLASHKRIWIISYNGLYQMGVTKNGRFIFPPDFHIVFEGYGSAIYLRGG